MTWCSRQLSCLLPGPPFEKRFNNEVVGRLKVRIEIGVSFALSSLGHFQFQEEDCNHSALTTVKAERIL